MRGAALALALALFIIGIVVVVARNTMFAEAVRAGVSAGDAWGLSAFSYIRAQNGDGTNRRWRWPQNGNASLPAAAVAQLVTAGISVLMIAFMVFRKNAKTPAESQDAENIVAGREAAAEAGSESDTLQTASQRIASAIDETEVMQNSEAMASLDPDALKLAQERNTANNALLEAEATGDEAAIAEARANAVDAADEASSAGVDEDIAAAAREAEETG